MTIQMHNRIHVYLFSWTIIPMLNNMLRAGTSGVSGTCNNIIITFYYYYYHEQVCFEIAAIAGDWLHATCKFFYIMLYNNFCSLIIAFHHEDIIIVITISSE